MKWKTSKYAGIGPVVNSKAKVHVVPSDQHVAKRRSELFKRISCSRVYDWLGMENERDSTESIYDLIEPMQQVAADSASSIGVVSVVDPKASHTIGTNGILVDLRDFEKYKNERIVHSINFPATLIIREDFPARLIEYKRKRGKAPLILYHQDDKTSGLYATQLIEKGWEEVFIVNGGFDEFKSMYPEFVEHA